MNSLSSLFLHPPLAIMLSADKIRGMSSYHSSQSWSAQIIANRLQAGSLFQHYIFLLFILHSIRMDGALRLRFVYCSSAQNTAKYHKTLHTFCHCNAKRNGAITALYDQRERMVARLLIGMITIMLA